MASSLDDALDYLAINPHRKGPECGIGVLLKTLPDKTAAKLLATIDNQEIPTTQIAKALKTNGHNVNLGAIRRHRARGTATGCACK